MSAGDQLATNLARIYEAKAGAQAAAVRAKGQIYGGTLASLGQIPSMILDQREQARQQAAQREDQAQARQIRDVQLTGAEVDLAAKQAWRAAQDLPGTPHEKLQRLAAVDPAKAKPLGEAYADIIEKQLQGATAETYPRVKLIIEQYGGPEASAALPEAFDQAAIRSIIQSRLPADKYLAATAPPKPPTPVQIETTDDQGQPETRFVTPTPGTSYPKPAPKPASTPNVGSFEDYVTRTYGTSPTPDQVLTARKAYGQADDRPVSAGGGAQSTRDAHDASDVVEAVKGMADGTIPPILPSRASREYGAIMAESHRQGVNLVKLNEDWNATQRYLSTLNGQQQVRLRQAISFTKDSLPIVERLAGEWDAGKFPLLNKANLALAKNGAFGQKAASLATKLDGQISDIQSELGTVYKGGNSSTDESLKLAAKNLQSEWSKKTMLDNIAQIRRNLEIREHSILLGAPIANQDNRYAPSTPTIPTAGAVEEWVRDPSGKLVKKGTP